MKSLIQKLLKWVDARAEKDAMYAEYLRKNQMNWGAY